MLEGLIGTLYQLSVTSEECWSETCGAGGGLRGRVTWLIVMTDSARDSGSVPDLGQLLWAPDSYINPCARNLMKHKA